MKILLVGRGGREHALAWRLAQPGHVEHVYCAPGNAGTALEDKLSNVNIQESDFRELADFAEREQIDLTVIGPEQPLVDGVVDYFAARGLVCFGPSKKAAQLEGSKSFTKSFLQRHQIPTAAYGVFTEVVPALAYLESQSMPVVIKADGLAAGKGVVIAEDHATATAAIEDMLSGNAFGEAGHQVVIEEFMVGEEASFIVMADGKHVVTMATSQDHKRAYDQDQGPNTGGMGAYSPAPVVTPDLDKKIMQTVIEPTIKGLADEGMPFVGFLYAGLMITPEGEAKVVEFNCRFGDPETQPILMRLQSDLALACLAATEGQLDKIHFQWSPQAALGVVLASGGYPGAYEKGHQITGLPQLCPPDCKVFHAGTELVDGKVVTNGGRVLCVTALGDTVAKAQQRAYQFMAQIHWQEMMHREDIGYRAIERENQLSK